ncbi:MAG TPA: SPOCS domain-containing protein [Oscillospiraceae bacterium]|nr:SPOCS domain-containing protein [Oscillospiraceae bacterium]
MSVELIKDVFKFEQVAGKNVTQAIVEGDILVPDTKPDITRVLSVDANVKVNKQKAEEGRIVVEGVTYFKILYVSEKEEQPLYSIDSSAGFEQDIEIEGVDTEIKSEVTVEIEHVSFTVNNERKVGVKAIINLIGKCIEEKTIEITKDLEGLEDIQVSKKIFQYTDVVGTSKSETLIKDGFELGEDEYEIEEILKWNATVLERETKITDGKLVAGGVVNLELLYVDDEYDNQLKMIKRGIPFTHFVDIADVSDDMQYRLRFAINELYHDVKENIRGEKKIVEIEGIVEIEAKVMDTRSKDILVDTYSLSKELEITKEQIELKENIGMNKSNVLIKDALDISSNDSPVAEVFSIDIKPILTDYNAVMDKVTIEGMLEVVVMYRAVEESRSLYSFIQEVPFRHYVEFEGSDEGMEAEIELFIEEIDYNIINGEQVELKVNIGAVCEVFCTKIIDIISSVKVAEEGIDPKAGFSLTIYYMQPDDTLWEVAKTYRTTVQRILDTNQIEDPSDIGVRDHIIIEKVHSFKF